MDQVVRQLYHGYTVWEERRTGRQVELLSTEEKVRMKDISHHKISDTNVWMVM